MNRLMPLFVTQAHREALIHVRQPRNILFSVLFFIMIAVLFPLTMPFDTVLLHQIVPGLLWTAILFSFLFTSERLFQQDYYDGVIEQWLVSGRSLPTIVMAKISVHWLINVLPMLVIMPIIGLLFGLSGHELFILIVSLILGTPAMLYLCALAAAFCGGAQQKGVLMALILFPLVLPIMIFGSSTLIAAQQALSVSGYMAILTALSLVAVAFLPVVIAAVIRISLSE